MAFDFYSTYSLLMAVEQLPPVNTFLRDRYFPTNDASDIFATNEVLVEYRDGSKKLAPFVAPRQGGVTMLRKGYCTKAFTPPNIAPRRLLTMDDLKRKGFGEALYSTLTPEERARVMLTNDAYELRDFIRRREEWMCAQVMQTGGCVMEHIADDAENGEELEVRYYDGDSNPAVYTPTTKWDQDGAKVFEDLAAMVRMLTSKGLPATDLVCAPDAADAVIRAAEVVGLLDNRRYELGQVEPMSLPSGAARVAVLNVLGRMLNIISYDETYTDEAGTDQPYLASGNVILTAPNAGRTVYGAVSQVEQYDGEVHTYPNRYVPKYYSDAEKNTRSLTLTSCPLPMPNHKNPFIVANVLGE